MAHERLSGAPRLDQPREARRSLFNRPQVDPDTFGRFAEKFVCLTCQQSGALCVRRICRQPCVV